MIGRNDIRVLLDGGDIVDACAGTRHFVFADEEFGGRREGRNNFGVRIGERNNFPHDACNGRRGGSDKIFGDGFAPAENFRRGLLIVLGVRSIQICAGGEKNFFVAFRLKNRGGVTVQARRLNERAQPESFAVLPGIPAAVRQFKFGRRKLDDFIFGRNIRRAGSDNFFGCGTVRGTCKKFNPAQKKYRASVELHRSGSSADNRGGIDFVLIDGAGQVSYNRRN